MTASTQISRTRRFVRPELSLDRSRCSRCRIVLASESRVEETKVVTK